MSAADELLRAVQAFIDESRGSPRLENVVGDLRRAVENLQGSEMSPGARASKQAMTAGDKYQQYKRINFNPAGQEPQLPSEDPGQVQSGQEARAHAERASGGSFSAGQFR